MVRLTCSMREFATPVYGVRFVLHRVSVLLELLNWGGVHLKTYIYLIAHVSHTSNAFFLIIPLIITVAMAQVMQRLRLNWLGEAAPEAATKNTFKVVLTLILCYTVFTIALEMTEASSGYYQIPTWIPVLRFIGGVLFTIYSIYSLMKLRENVRAKYSIPEERCSGMEDLCCSMWCSCCVVSQMARHTGEYETYKGRFCSETGMAAHTPSIV